ncbi:MAG: TolC family protein, partial [Acidobacteria bacterium]|nr:TolC family protein [Acidobacteriota bacterium]
MKRTWLKRNWLWSVFLAAMVISPARAQQQGLTLEDCLRFALAAPSTVQSAERDQSIAAERQTVARAGLLPRLAINSTYAYNSPNANAPNPFSFVALNGVREYLAVADVSWSMDLSGRLRAGLARERAGSDIAAADLAIARRDIRRAVTPAYYDLLLARRIVQLEQGSLDEARQFEHNVRARQAQGDASRADALKASAQRSQFEQRFAQAQLDAKLANQILASFWTVDVDTDLPVVDVLDSTPALPAEIVGGDTQQAAAALAQRPELSRIDALGRTFIADRKIARAGLKPDASLVFQYGIDANQVRSDQLGYAAFVNVNVPVFDWFRSRSGAREANYRQEQTRIQRASTERALTREYRAARSRVMSWHERISMAQNESHAARENLRLVRLLYENGEGAALDVVISQA